MRTQVQKWGNSLALRIPKAFALDLGIAQDAPVELVLEDGCLVIRPLEIPRYDLAGLLERIDADNVHGEVDFGTAKGAEAW